MKLLSTSSLFIALLALAVHSAGAQALWGEAAFEDAARLEKEQSDLVLRDFAGSEQEILRRLNAYKAEVAAHSYSQTLRLCLAYRQATGLGLPHDLPPEYSVSDSLKTWGEIYGHGLYQTIDGFAGLKSDYIDISGLGVFDFNSWFRSLYVLDFISSAGFLSGASHCLNTVQAHDIQKFAAAILSVDQAGTLTSWVALDWSIVKLGGLIASGVSRWVWHPLSSSLSRFATRLPKPSLVAVTGPAAIILGDNFNCHMIELEALQQGLQKYTDALKAGAVSARLRRVQNTLTVARALRAAGLACASGDKSKPSRDCQRATDLFQQTVRDTGFASELADYKTDLTGRTTHSLDTRGLQACDGIKATTTASDSEADYLEILSVVLPFVERLGPSGKA